MVSVGDALPFKIKHFHTVTLESLQNRTNKEIQSFFGLCTQSRINTDRQTDRQAERHTDKNKQTLSFSAHFFTLHM